MASLAGEARRIRSIRGWAGALLPRTGTSARLTMTHRSTDVAADAAGTHLRSGTQDAAIHMIAAAARILLMLGTAILIGEVAAGPARRLLEHRGSSNGGSGDPQADQPDSP